MELTRPPGENLERQVGLCLTCRHGRQVSSSRDSTFWLCELSIVDARFLKYPRLPVTSCTGYAPRGGGVERSD
jgi:hypothetical protein